MDDMGFRFMVMAYFAVWIVLFVYIFFIGSKVFLIQKDIQHLTEVVKKKSK